MRYFQIHYDIMSDDLTPDNLIGHAPVDFFICQSNIYLQQHICTSCNMLSFTEQAE